MPQGCGCKNRLPSLWRVAVGQRCVTPAAAVGTSLPVCPPPRSNTGGPGGCAGLGGGEAAAGAEDVGENPRRGKAGNKQRAQGKQLEMTSGNSQERCTVSVHAALGTTRSLLGCAWPPPPSKSRQPPELAGWSWKARVQGKSPVQSPSLNLWLSQAFVQG